MGIVTIRVQETDGHRENWYRTLVEITDPMIPDTFFTYHVSRKCWFRNEVLADTDDRIKYLKEENEQLLRRIIELSKP